MNAAALLQACRARGWRIASAESCTGGLLGAALTALPGSSDVYECGFISYSNAAKIALLGVSPASLEAHGAVSEPVAGEMAAGALARTGVELAVSITGIAGPGGSDFKPEGLVCFAIASKAGVRRESVAFGALGRDKLRAAATSHALELLLAAIRDSGQD